MKIGQGTLVINDGVYVNKKNTTLSKFAKGIVRKNYVYEEPISPSLVPSDSQKSFDIKVNCIHRMAIYRNEISYDTNIVFSNEKEYRRTSGKNYLKDIKNFICPWTGSIEASKVRKRLIALERIQKTISNQSINFIVTDRS